MSDRTLPPRESGVEARRITVWWCDECGYGRLEKTTGRHQTANRNNPNGRLVAHDLRPVVFIAEEDFAASPAPQTPAVSGEEGQAREALEMLKANAVLQQNLQDDNVAVRIPIDAWRGALGLGSRSNEGPQ